MFCFQCEQTAGCAGCTGKSGVCGKSAANAKLQDQLTGALIGLAHAASNAEKTPQTDRLILEGLFTTVTNVNFNDDTLTHLIDRDAPTALLPAEIPTTTICPGSGTQMRTSVP